MFFEEATPEPRPRRAAPAPEPCPRRGRSRAAPVPVPRPRPSRARAAPEPRPCPSRSEPSRSRDIGFRAPEKWFDVCILNMISEQFCADPGPGLLGVPSSLKLRSRQILLTPSLRQMLTRAYAVAWRTGIYVFFRFRLRHAYAKCLRELTPCWCFNIFD